MATVFYATQVVKKQLAWRNKAIKAIQPRYSTTIFARKVKRPFLIFYTF